MRSASFPRSSGSRFISARSQTASMISMRLRPVNPPPPPPPDGSRFEDFLAHYNIRQASVSVPLAHLLPRLYHRYGLSPAQDPTAPTVFVGMYRPSDVARFRAHAPGKRFMRPGGNDARRVAMLHRLPDAPPIFAVSLDLKARLQQYGASATYARWDIVDRRLFRPPPEDRKGKSIYVYNGRVIGSEENIRKRAYMVYGQGLVDEVARLRPQYTFIKSNEHGLQPYEAMPAIYEQCCIALRLTKHDGTANMVQELAAMEIPVVHNQSEYGLKWNNVEDVIMHVDTAMKSAAGAPGPSEPEPALVVSSTQYPGYGGAATNAYELIKALRAAGYKTAGVFFHNDEGVNADPDSIGGVYMHRRNYKGEDVRRDTIGYLGRSPTTCLAKNYLAPQYCKQIFGCRTVYLVSGINHFRVFFPNMSGTEVLEDSFQLGPEHVLTAEVKTLGMVDEAINNSRISNEIFRKIYPQFRHKIRPGYVDTTASVLRVPQQEKRYDIVLGCSRLSRVQKNNMAMLAVLKRPEFADATKLVIGAEAEAFRDLPNVTLTGLLDHESCVRALAQSRVLLFPSLFDSNSNTVREAYHHGCLPLITRNVGYSEVFPPFLICESFEPEEWARKLIHVLHSCDTLRNTEIPFPAELDVDSLLM